MTDYKSMYTLLCAAASKAIDLPEMEAKELLRQAPLDAEEIYIRTADAEETQ